jgi:transposase
MARFAGAFWFLEKHAPTLQPVVQERRFRSCIESLGQRRRHRIRDDRRHHRPGPSAQCRGAKKNGEDQAIGRSRGGLTTKIHALADALGNPVRLILTAGHVHDVRAAGQLLEGVACGALLGDKGYDADALIEQLRDARIAAVIPPRSNRKEKRECDFTLYKERNLIERLFEKLKQFRAIATRYDKLARNFLGAIRLVAAVIQLN